MKKGIAIFGKCGIIKTIQKEVTRRTMTMSNNTADIYETLFPLIAKILLRRTFCLVLPTMTKCTL